jgi:adenylate cyclase
MGKKTLTTLVTKSVRLPSKGEKRLITAMTIGIRQFEHMCSELDAGNLIAFMKGYYREVKPLLYDEDAYVMLAGNDKLVCTLGAPMLHSDHALRACRAMLGIRRAVAKRRAGWKERYRLGTLRLAAGIHTGPMAIGDAGNGFAAVGVPLDMSSLWARIAHTYRVSIICGSETVHAAREKFFFRPLDYVRVPHGQYPMEIYELMGERSIATPYMDVYLRAYEAYRERDYNSVITAAEKVLKNLPHDGPTQLIKARSERFLKKPPKKEWNGAWSVK